MAPPRQERETLVLTHVRDADGTMWRAVHLTADGRLLIEGHDLGAGVEKIFGTREYEFERSLSVEETSRLGELLEVAVPEILGAVERRFGSTHLLEEYLEEHDIAGELWSRTGD
jgi:hypothetical protein